VGHARLVRLFWLSAAVTVLLAGGFALAGVVGGDLGETPGKILGTLGTALLAGAVATTGATLVDASLSSPLGQTLVGVVVIPGLVCIAAVWNGFSSEALSRTAGSSYVLLAAGLLIGTARALVGARRWLLLLFGAVFALTVLASLLSILAIVGNAPDAGYGEALAAVWILAGVAYLLVPIARRLVTLPAAGGMRLVDLSAGVEAAGTRVRLATGRATLSRETVVVVLTGEARAGGLEIAAGESAIAHAGTELDLGESGSAILVGR
jgi:hypothetical protein